MLPDYLGPCPRPGPLIRVELILIFVHHNNDCLDPGDWRLLSCKVLLLVSKLILAPDTGQTEQTGR